MPEPMFDAPDSSPPLPPAVTAPTAGKGEAPRSLDDLTGSGDAQYDAITKADTALTKQKIGAEAGMEAQRQRSDASYAARQERMLAAEGATMEDLKPWDATKEMSKRETNLWEQFGSPGFVIAMLASTFTAMPMNSALNAGAAAMNAINQGKMDDYNKAFDAWKENSNLTIKRLDIEEHEFSQIDNLRSKNMESWRAAATALATRFNDQRMLAMLQNGYDSQALEARDALTKSRLELDDATQRMKENEVRRQITMAFLGESKDPEKLQKAAHDAQALMDVNFVTSPGPKTPAQLAVAHVITQPGFHDLPSAEQNKQIQEAARSGVRTASRGVQGEIDARTARWDDSHPEASDEEKDEAHDKIATEVVNAHKSTQLPAAQRDKITAQIDAYDNNIALIDDLKERIKKYNFSVGILSGIPLAGEKMADVLAGSSAADRAQIKRDIERLKLGASRLLLDAQGRPLAASEHRIDSIIGGGNYGDTTANVLKSLDAVEGDYTTMREQHKKRLSGGGTGGAPADEAAPPKTDPSWDAFPTVGIKGTD